jgi:hypothetical protein
MTQKKEEITEGPLRAETKHDPKKSSVCFSSHFLLSFFKLCRTAEKKISSGFYYFILLFLFFSVGWWLTAAKVQRQLERTRGLHPTRY